MDDPAAVVKLRRATVRMAFVISAAGPHNSTGRGVRKLAERERASRQALVALENGNETKVLRLIFDTLAEFGLEMAVRPRLS